jgi:hypothetical protein
MGTQSTNFLWENLPKLSARPAPALWHFRFAPTAIPGASTVRIYVGPWGRVVATEPGDLVDRLVAFHRPAY